MPLVACRYRAFRNALSPGDIHVTKITDGVGGNWETERGRGQRVSGRKGRKARGIIVS